MKTLNVSDAEAALIVRALEEFADQCLCSNRVPGHLCSCSLCGSRKGTAGRWWFTEPPVNKLERWGVGGGQSALAKGSIVSV